MESKPLTIYEAFDLKMDKYYDEFCNSYLSNMEIFSERRDYYLQGICERTEMFDTYFEAGTSNPLMKMLETIQKFIDTMAEKTLSLFKKNDVDKSLSELKAMKIDKNYRVETDTDYQYIIANDEKLRKRLEASMKVKNGSDIKSKADELEKVTEEYAAMKKAQAFKKTKIVITVAALLSAILYFKNRSSDYKTYNSFVKSEMKKMKNGTHEIVDPVKQREYAEHIRNVASAIKESESIKIPLIGGLIVSLKRTIRMKKEELVSIGKITKKMGKKIIFDEGRKAKHDAEKAQEKEDRKIHKAEVQKRLKVLQKWGKKEQN